MGLLTGKYNDGIPEGSRADTSEWLKGELNEANLNKVRQLMEIAADLKLSVGQLALAWVLRLPEISSAITGATRMEHIESNAAASDAELDRSTINAIEKILKTDN